MCVRIWLTIPTGPIQWQNLLSRSRQQFIYFPRRCFGCDLRWCHHHSRRYLLGFSRKIGLIGVTKRFGHRQSVSTIGHHSRLFPSNCCRSYGLHLPQQFGIRASWTSRQGCVHQIANIRHQLPNGDTTSLFVAKIVNWPANISVFFFISFLFGIYHDHHAYNYYFNIN